ncbi:mitochondrial membrane protein [Clydaea vesicula]|uniref:Mitochondrial fission 1 protein n=1 Tax=Clydaea vesicula TaxID=447962 RepID=A0AAD5XY08_9FUNG|nr:mitochondrial membrane protein [Clydaea vesicula]KAJ3394786.1 mitochondrial membrane protein [Lobulomyces angularis]
MSYLPTKEESEALVGSNELATLRQEYEEDQKDQQKKFNYSWALVRSNTRKEQEIGVLLLHEIYKQNTSRRRECLYYLALGEFKLGHYTEARKFTETLLQKEPNNPQAVQLLQQIDDKVKSEGVIGIAIAGVAIAAVGLLVGALTKKH